MRLAGAVLLVALTTQPILGRQNFQTSVPNSAKGFEKQFKAILKAHDKRNQDELTQGLRSFAIPESWFIEAFGVQEGSKLATEYAGRFERFTFATVRELNIMAVYSTQNSSQVQTKPWESQSKSASAKSSPLPPLQRFRIRFLTGPNFEIDENGRLRVSSKGYDKIRVIPFVYLDGQFRFVGRTLSQRFPVAPEKSARP